jgi:hypothetical protein
MPRIVLQSLGFLSVLGCVSCGAADDPGVERDPGAAPAAETSESRTMVPEALQGSWYVKGLNAAGDSITAFILEAPADPNGWTSLLPGRDPLAIQIRGAGGDSVIFQSGPYESVLQAGVHVLTDGVLHASGDRIWGSWLSHRSVTGPDSILRGTYEGTRRR